MGRYGGQCYQAVIGKWAQQLPITLPYCLAACLYAVDVFELGIEESGVYLCRKKG